ncbi:MAG: hypothetical protein Q4E69_00960 [Bacilli bacterium]|nr:hypothetical protein [Bacilli bacterium]
MNTNYVKKLRVWKKAYELGEEKNIKLMEKVALCDDKGLVNKSRHYQKLEFMNNIERKTIRDNLTRLFERDPNSLTNKMIKLLENEYLLDDDKYNLLVLKNELESNEFEISLLREHINNYRKTDTISLMELRKELILKTIRRNNITKSIRRIEPKVNAFRNTFSDYMKRIDN